MELEDFMRFNTAFNEHLLKKPNYSVKVYLEQLAKKQDNHGASELLF